MTLAKIIYNRLFWSCIKTSRFIFFYFKWFFINLQPGVSLAKGAKVSLGVSVKVTDGGSVQIESGVFISRNVKIVAQSGRVVIKKAVYIGDGTMIVAKDSIFIGSDSLIAERVTIRDQDHSIYGCPRNLISDSGFNVKPVVINENVWICAGAVITKGVDIGSGAVVAANSVANKNIPAKTIVGGVPAKIIGVRG